VKQQSKSVGEIGYLKSSDFAREKPSGGSLRDLDLQRSGCVPMGLFGVDRKRKLFSDLTTVERDEFEDLKGAPFRVGWVLDGSEIFWHFFGPFWPLGGH
jgi:hypothetical protein